MLVKQVLETIDNIVRDSEARKKKGYNIEKRTINYPLPVYNQIGTQN